MSAKNRDEKNRWRNITIGFRVSPEEAADIDMRVRLSGLTKQDYITRRLQERDIVVMGNPRVYKALKDELAKVLFELERIQNASELSDCLTDTIQLITVTLDGMKSK